MPSIYNVNNVYTSNNMRKEKTSLSFKSGETFSARAVSGEGNEVKLKLLDGWQFDAEIVDGLDLLNGSLCKFKVEGLEDGKLKLRIMDNFNEGIEEGITVDNLLESMNLSSDDKELAKLLMKYNIDLSKENIDITKSLISMNEKANLDADFIGNFISKFLEGKAIDKNSPEGLNIAKELKQFLNGLKSLNKEEILFFLENNLDINKNNVDAFEEVFKKDFGLYKEINNELNEVVNPSEGENEYNKAINIENIQSDIGVDDRGVKNLVEGMAKDLIEGKNDNKDAVSDKPINVNKEDVTVKNNESNIKNDDKLNGLSKKNDENVMKEIKQGLEEICGKEIPVTKKDVLEILKFSKGEKSTLPKELTDLPRQVRENVKEFIQEFGKNIDIDEKIKVVSDSIGRDNYINEKADNILKNIKSSKEEGMDIKKLLPSDDKDKIDVIKTVLGKLEKDKSVQSLRNLVKEPLENLQKASEVKLALKEAMNNIKTSIEALMNGQKDTQNLKLLNEIKMFNNLSDEYYYMNVPFKLANADYGCKIIIKDKRKDGKEIDSKNMKMVVTVDAPLMGKVDGYIHVLNKNMNIKIEAAEKWIGPLKKSENKLYTSLENLGYNINIDFKEKRDDIDIVKCRKYFSDDIWALDKLV